jgi:hypothetical protein
LFLQAAHIAVYRHLGSVIGLQVGGGSPLPSNAKLEAVAEPRTNNKAARASSTLFFTVNLLFRRVDTVLICNGMDR